MVYKLRFVLGLFFLILGPPPRLGRGVALFGVSAAHLGAALRPLSSLGRRLKFWHDFLNAQLKQLRRPRWLKSCILLLLFLIQNILNIVFMLKFTGFVLCLFVLFSASSCHLLNNVPGGHSPVYNCVPAGPQAFNQATNVVRDRMMDNDKLQAAQQQTNNLRCLTSQQISQLTGMMMMEKNKLDYAKFAFPFCADPGNYGIMNQHFMMDRSKRELGQITGVN